MRITSEKRLKDYWENDSNFEQSGRLWITRMRACSARNLIELRTIFGTADSVGNFTVFNLRGNTYRLVVLIDYDSQRVFVRHIMTHSEYDTDKWKNDDWF